MASIKDVAKCAGVSISTVSNVLNETKYVSDELCKKVNLAVRKLGYEADAVARNMKTGNTKTIGVITADICGLFYPYVLKGIYEVTSDRGYNLIICDTQTINDNENALAKEEEGFRKLIANRVDGIIFVSSIKREDASKYFSKIKKKIGEERKVAFVSVERDFSNLGIDSVFYENTKASYNAVEHLYGMSCRKIAHITGPLYYAVVQDRLSGYKKAVCELKLEIDFDLMVEKGDYTHQSGYLAMKRLLEKNHDIDGVFVANDQMAMGTIKYLLEYGYKVPEDIKVIGCDNVFASSMVQPSLSTINIRKREMGMYAAQILLEKLDLWEKGEEDIACTVSKKLETRLVVRKSTSADAEEDWTLSDW